MSDNITANQQGSIEGSLIRGGTSKGFFVHDENVPVGGDQLNDLLLEIFGSPDPLQINGIGGSKSHTSKVMLLDSSNREGVDVEYTYGQVGVNEAVVDWSGNCGNLTSAVGMAAILEGLVDASGPTTNLTLYNTNTNILITQEVPIQQGEPSVYGEYSIDGVPGTGAKVTSHFHDPTGGVTGSLLPTGNVVDTIRTKTDEIDVSIIDATNLVVFVRARDLRLSGTELPDELEAHSDVLDRIECIRSVVADITNLDGTPGLAIVSEPSSYECSTEKHVNARDIDITSRYISLQPHHAHAMTGAMCLATATQLPNSIPSEFVSSQITGDGITIGHPKGDITVGVEISGTNNVERITNYRTARPLLEGKALYRYENV